MTGGALVVAAGFSRRFGADKRLHPIGTSQRPMLIATLETYCAAFPNVAVVVRSDDSEVVRVIMSSFARRPPIIVTTDHAALGMGASLADGVRAIAAWDYAFIGLGDMPFVRTATLTMLDRLMRNARREGRPQIVVPVVRGVPGHPVGFSCELFGALVALQGDRGARTVIDANASLVRHVETDDDGTIRDLDERPS